MKKLLTTMLGVTLIIVIAAGLTTTGCKKRARKEPPPPPPVEQPRDIETMEPDTTGQGERDRMARMEADRARIQTVYFDFDRSDIRTDQRAKITTNAEIFRTWTEWQITVEGHCDERGTNEYNLALGERRATSARQALVAAGVDGSRISTISYGEERPVDPGSNEDGWARNRRAEFRAR